MGVYSDNRSSLGPMNIVAAEGYNGAIGAAQIMIETCQNDQAFFEAVINNDFKEAFGIAEGTILESELTVLSEASFGGILDKIKEMLKKLAEKIKGVFQAFKARVSQVFVRDNKKFVDMHKKSVTQKDLSKMKYKYSKPTGNEMRDIKFDFHIEYNDFASIKDIKSLSEYNERTFGDNSAEKKSLGSVIGQNEVEVSEFAKEFHSYMFNDADEVEGITSQEISAIMSALYTGAEVIKDAEKCMTKNLKAIDEAIKAIDKSRNAIAKFIPGSDSGSVKIDGDDVKFNGKNERDLINAKLNAMYKAATVVQSVTTRTSAAALTEAKFGLAQQRRVFAQAAAYSPKHEACFMDIVAEASDAEVDDEIDGYEDIDLDEE